jgi:hypothetical protein
MASLLSLMTPHASTGPLGQALLEQFTAWWRFSTGLVSEHDRIGLRMLRSEVGDAKTEPKQQSSVHGEDLDYPLRQGGKRW